jgi:hypothetical protein
MFYHGSDVGAEGYHVFTTAVMWVRKDTVFYRGSDVLQCWSTSGSGGIPCIATAVMWERRDTVYRHGAEDRLFTGGDCKEFKSPPGCNATR